ncbi:hypothetical protein EX30DRAFT_128780 [Ascodesmis nigricans]|uniref:Uncharacterized protein n=1 Tax=Ascodesmis nigricans TaxID=341454 RepID=A0A4S2MNZ6_9PEZI|nr:hypothetical protein EX30DRAFT_128780 [Ascodesmis nigricans]
MGLTITEGAPTTTTRVFHCGRGGAGNYHSVPKNLPAPPTTIPSAPRANFYAGRGGAGNARNATERAAFSFDEEIERDRIFHEHHASVYSVGRGGAGNIVTGDARSQYSGRSDATPRSSTCTDRSSASSINSANHSGLADRVMRTISRVRSSASSN